MSKSLSEIMSGLSMKPPTLAPLEKPVKEKPDPDTDTTKGDSIVKKFRPRTPKVPFPHVTKPTNEEAVNAIMTTATVPTTQDPNINYAQKRKKQYKNKLMRRRK